MSQSIKKSNKVSAGAAGIGGGTLLVLFANQLPEADPLKQWLLLVAPTVSITLTAIWLWLKVEIANFVQDKKVKSLANAAKIALQEALENPLTSDLHKEKIRIHLEEVESLLAARHLSKLKNLRVKGT